MKTVKNSLIVLSVLLLIACGSEKKEMGLPSIDVSKSYPKKEIVLQDIANVEYVPLETRDDVLLGYCQIVPAGKGRVLAYSMRSGDIFIFDTNGKFLNKFNHKGQSGQEYFFISKVIVDSQKDEIFIVDGYKNKNIQVYTMQGKYKRTLKVENMAVSSNLIGFGADKIVCYKDPNKKSIFSKDKKDLKHTSLAVLDRGTGKTATTIELPTTKEVNPYCFFPVNGQKGFIIRQTKLFVQAPQGIIVNEVACDTVFALNKEQKLVPLLARTPKVSPTDEPLKMLGIEAATNEAFYLEVILKKYDPKTRKGFDRTTYQLEKATNQIFEYTLKNADVNEVDKLARLEEYSLITADKLIELLEEGKLKGKLKEIAGKLTEDDNPVLMKVTLK